MSAEARTLDEAWAAAEAALPEYWRIRSLIEVGIPPILWEVVATEGRAIRSARGRTPAEALEKLAALFDGLRAQAVPA